MPTSVGTSSARRSASHSAMPRRVQHLRSDGGGGNLPGHGVTLGQVDAQPLQAGGRCLRAGVVDADAALEDAHGQAGSSACAWAGEMTTARLTPRAIQMATHSFTCRSWALPAFGQASPPPEPRCGGIVDVVCDRAVLDLLHRSSTANRAPGTIPSGRPDSETVLDFDVEPRRIEDPMDQVFKPCPVDVEELVGRNGLRRRPSKKSGRGVHWRYGEQHCPSHTDLVQDARWAATIGWSDLLRST